VRNILVASEVALSVTLLIGAGLLLNSFIRLQRVDPGFQMDNLAVLTLSLSSTTFPEEAQRSEFARQLEQRLEALPGVQRVSITGGLPPTAGLFMTEVAFEVQGEQPRPQPPDLLVPETAVGPDFFEVTGARLLAGRAFTEEDDRQSGNVIIDEDLARYLWPDRSPLGQRFRVRSEEPWYTVVGVMADLKLMGADDRRVRFELLRPLTTPSGYLALAIRTISDPRPLLPSIRAAVREVNPNQPIWELAPATVLYAEAIDLPRFLTVLVTTLAALALTLAAIGIFGVLAYVVNQRQHEFGIRLALGARAEDLRRMIVRQGFQLALAGAVIGLSGALVLTRFIGGTLYGVQPNDPVTLAIVMVTMLSVALLACLQPARRATTLDPAAVLRSE
jgi:predicted permease